MVSASSGTLQGRGLDDLRAHVPQNPASQGTFASERNDNRSIAGIED
jgi:hypothetical protein